MNRLQNNTHVAPLSPYFENPKTDTNKPRLTNTRGEQTPEATHKRENKQTPGANKNPKHCQIASGVRRWQMWNYLHTDDILDIHISWPRGRLSEYSFVCIVPVWRDKELLRPLTLGEQAYTILGFALFGWWETFRHHILRKYIACHSRVLPSSAVRTGVCVLYK